jgi:hypothetical protein
MMLAGYGAFNAPFELAGDHRVAARYCRLAHSVAVRAGRSPRPRPQLRCPVTVLGSACLSRPLRRQLLCGHRLAVEAPSAATQEQWAFTSRGAPNQVWRHRPIQIPTRLATWAHPGCSKILEGGLQALAANFASTTRKTQPLERRRRQSRLGIPRMRTLGPTRIVASQGSSPGNAGRVDHPSTEQFDPLLTRVGLRMQSHRQAGDDSHGQPAITNRRRR